MPRLKLNDIVELFSRSGSRSWFRSLALLLVFLILLLLPLSLLLGTKLVSTFSGGSWEISQIASFSRAVDVLCIKHRPELNPQQGRDFMISGWFRISELPRSDRRLVLFSKYSDDRQMNGYVLALERDADRIRPAVFWRNAAGQGNWKSFSEVSIAPNVWFMFTLSFYEGRYLGLHYALRQGSQRVVPQLTGGYELPEGILPSSEAPLCTGMYGVSGFRGALGMLSVFAPHRLERKIHRVVKSTARFPTELPSEFEVKDVVLRLVSEEDARPFLVAGKDKAAFVDKARRDKS